MLVSTTRDHSEIGNTGTSAEPIILRDDPTRANAGYRIGAASRLTGITADTLRVWERLNASRPGAVAPSSLRETAGGGTVARR